LHRHVQDAYRFDRFGQGFVDILSAEQTEYGDDWYQGTADAVRRNLIHFGANDEDIFVILSGDQLYRMDFSKMVDEHLERGAEITVAAKPVSTEEASGLGLLRVGEEASIVDFVEKPTDPEVISRLVPSELKGDDKNPDRCLASMGIYVFNASAMFEALKGDSKDFGKEIIPSLVGKRNLKCHIYDDYWEDIGTVRSFFEANLQLCSENPEFNFYEQNHPIYNYPDLLPMSKFKRSSLVETNFASGCVIGDSDFKRCVLGVRSIIGDECSFENVVMMGADNYEVVDSQKIPVGVGSNSKIENAIIDKNARIGKDVQLSPKGVGDGWADEGENVYVRDGIVVVVKNGIVPDETRIGAL
jgi:glucose-1-phosphate adenylyltransferase